MEINGNVKWQETRAGQQLQERLSNEKSLNGIDHLLQRIDTLEKAVEQLTTVINQGPGMISMFTDTADEEIRKASERGVDLNQRMGNALILAEKITAPETVKKIEDLMQLTDMAPGLVAMAGDILDEESKKIAASGIDVNVMFDTLGKLGRATTKAKDLPEPKLSAALRMMGLTDDPDRKRAIAYIMKLAKAFGQELK